MEVSDLVFGEAELIEDVACEVAVEFLSVEVVNGIGADEGVTVLIGDL